ncbi:aliphatic sulfonate ABC transporter substrate-binding protein [Alicyclobacillus cycloheptanicus]|uniref:Taurine transport system substrate-binding protein n=1 Tax=Alicyclobacillus cycloheptanicus TaxID=1457 RepID=A0ABT9XKS4_9BACL|nr:aliphatic sulfonate ABC transporter substrate-binding protein [Alicyclobacillus cycloheptanicus]MDQ0190336.1 taurine transport system substrate-binding protein [Alicyclobacillus cycloheptanicus]WDM00022.1 aliphatic sulfonate ABC transporter substrate-binding protein [Alicyclobacillus cycloheptanicus]
MGKRWKTWAAGCGAAAAAIVSAALVTACGTSQPAGAASSMPAQVKIGYQEIPNTEEIARAQGWAQQELKGTRIQYTPFSSGKDVIAAMSSGAIDIAVIGSSPAAAAIAQGTGYEVIYICDVEGKNEALVVKKNEHIDSLAGLKGHTIATPFGSTSAFSLFMALKQQGISDSSLKILDMEPQQILAAWERGNIDGAYVWEPTLSKMVSDGGTVILNSGQMAKRGVVTADILVARKDFAEKYPQVVADYLKANIRAYNFYEQHPTQAAAVIAKAFDISQPEAANDMKELVWLSPSEQLSSSYLGTQGHVGKMAQIMKNNADFMVTQGDLAQSAPVRTFDNAVAPQYLQQAAQ